MTLAKRGLEGGTLSLNRHFPRLVVEVAIDEHSEHNFWTGLARNIVSGGVFLATFHHVRVGSFVQLAIAIDGESEPATAYAEVLEHRPSTSSDIPTGYVLQFVDIDPVSISKIRNFFALRRAPLFFDID